MQNETFRLIVRRGPQPNQVYELAAEVSNLGRDITNDIVINDREVSRHHLRLMRGGDGITIEDLGSTNGTFVNGKRVTGATPLKNGDMVGLGETVTLQFEAGRTGQSVAPAAPSASAAQPATPTPIEDRFRPQQPAPQPEPAVYQKPRTADNPYQSPAPQPQPAAYNQPLQPAQSDAYNDYNAPAQGSYGPPPPGYDYDPYTMREPEGNNAMQWFLIGCLGLLLLCCCLTVIAAVAIDTFCMYDLIPGLTNVLQAIGMAPSC